MWLGFVTFVLGALAFEQTSVSAFDASNLNRDALIACLQRGTPSGSLLTPSSAGYNTSVLEKYNTRLTYWPVAIVFPSTSQEVSKFVKCAAKSGIPVVARSGGHSAASFSLGGQDGSLVIDLAKMKSVLVDASGTAVAQTGNRLGELAQKIWDNGKRALPHGLCPSVGSGGHAAFGGFGPFSRFAGLLHDRITAAEVVLANGTIATASTKQNPDLFWALRGAGASYGIVTQWTYATLPAPPSVIIYHVLYNATPLTPPQIADLLAKWQNIALSAPNTLSMSTTIGQSGGATEDTLQLFFRGAFYGTQPEFNDLTSKWSTILSPGNLTTQALNWYDGLVAFSGNLSQNTADPSVPVFVKSLFTKKPLSRDQWGSLLEYLGGKGKQVRSPWFVEIMRYGGKISSYSKDSTAFAHRDALLCFEMAAVDYFVLPPDGIPFANGIPDSFEPNPKAAYANYVDPSLTPAQWKFLYYGSHYPRLVSIKRAIDPQNVFRYPQSITLS